MMLNEHTAALIRKGPPRALDALTPIPASANSFIMTSEDEIGDTLTHLAEEGDAISMYVPGTREPVLGRILSVDPELPHFVMELNPGATLNPGKVTFVATLRAAKLQFRLSSLDWTSLPGQPALIPMIFPETCSVLNRRAHERMETPLGASFTASFISSDGHPHEWPIYDLSLGGMGLHCTKPEAKGLIKGKKVHDVLLELGDESVEIAELEVRFTRAFRSFLLGEQLHLGCMFVNPAPEALARIKQVLDQIHHS